MVGSTCPMHRCEVLKTLPSLHFPIPVIYKTWGLFLESPKMLSHLESRPKSQTLWLQSCFIHIFYIWTEVLSIHFTHIHISVLDTDKLKKTLCWPENVLGLQETGLWCLIGCTRKYPYMVNTFLKKFLAFEISLPLRIQRMVWILYSTTQYLKHYTLLWRCIGLVVSARDWF